jgi:hypothetical protein
MSDFDFLDPYPGNLRAHRATPPAASLPKTDRFLDDLFGDAPAALPEPVCVGCSRSPADIPEYARLAKELGTDADDAVRREEGTYNRSNGHFMCTACYLKAGQPASPQGWVAP